ncbi:Uncharacterized protein pbN1_37520 [Aromatoleum bremense]|nr:Uncharacterized protein pbN1_37520 [Aromatoleum bremense]
MRRQRSGDACIGAHKTSRMNDDAAILANIYASWLIRELCCEFDLRIAVLERTPPGR